MLYWADWSSTNPGIYRSSVLNPARETLINSNVSSLRTLAIDFTGK